MIIPSSSLYLIIVRLTFNSFSFWLLFFFSYSTIHASFSSKFFLWTKILHFFLLSLTILSQTKNLIEWKMISFITLRHFFSFNHPHLHHFLLAFLLFFEVVIWKLKMSVLGISESNKYSCHLISTKLSFLIFQASPRWN